MSISQDPLHLSYNNENSYYHTYLVLDSFEKNESSSDNNKGIYKFDLDNISKKTSDNKIGTGHHLKNIIEFNLMEFSIPMLPITSRPVDITDTLPFLKDYIQIDSFTDINYGGSSLINTGNNFKESKATQLINMGRIFIGIKELQSQSISNFQGFQHVEFETEMRLYPYPHLYCVPIKGLECIRLHTPLNSLETITLCFTNPDNPLILPKDVVRTTPKLRNIGDNASDALATLRLHLDFSEDLQSELLISSGDKVFFRHFDSREKKILANGNTLNTYVPFLDKHMNNSNGLYIDISNNFIYPSPNIDFQTTGAPTYNVVVPHWLNLSDTQLYYLPTDSGSTQDFNSDLKIFNMYIPRNRIRIPLNVTGIKNTDSHTAHQF